MTIMIVVRILLQTPITNFITFISSRAFMCHVFVTS